MLMTEFIIMCMFVSVLVASCQQEGNKQEKEEEKAKKERRDEMRREETRRPLNRLTDT